MIPIRDDNPVSRTPVVTLLVLAVIGVVWVVVQGAGLLSDGEPVEVVQ